MGRENSGRKERVGKGEGELYLDICPGAPEFLVAPLASSCAVNTPVGMQRSAVEFVLWIRTAWSIYTYTECSYLSGRPSSRLSIRTATSSCLSPSCTIRPLSAQPSSPPASASVFPHFSRLCADVNCDFVLILILYCVILILILYCTTTYYCVLFHWRCM